MRTSDRAALLMLAGMLSACGGAVDQDVDQAGEPVLCRTGESIVFARTCRLERIGAKGIIVHHSDGGFRRFVLSEEEGVISAADGAESVQVKHDADGAAMLVVGHDSYRIEAGQLQ